MSPSLKIDLRGQASCCTCVVDLVNTSSGNRDAPIAVNRQSERFDPVRRVSSHNWQPPIDRNDRGSIVCPGLSISPDDALVHSMLEAVWDVPIRPPPPPADLERVHSPGGRKDQMMGMEERGRGTVSCGEGRPSLLIRPLVSPSSSFVVFFGKRK